jgi:hypothetical protein
MGYIQGPISDAWDVHRLDAEVVQRVMGGKTEDAGMVIHNMLDLAWVG